MASHGVPRSAGSKDRSLAAREQELQQITQYRAAVDEVSRKVAEKDFSPELLQETAALLSTNPEYYTMWNVRRRIYAEEFDHLRTAATNGEITEASFPNVIGFGTTVYGYFSNRLSTFRLGEQESRNFHGWGYRRIVIENLESQSLEGNSMAQGELDYTTKMIGNNLSNFSAWHNRSKLIVRLLDEKSASPQERRDMLETELELVHKALFDPYDQSLWFYHQNLLCTFDPAWKTRSMAPDLSAEECAAYLNHERNFIQEVLEDADDCKWAYQALIDCALIEGKLNGSLKAKDQEDIKSWIHKLKKLDPLRIGRWSDMEAALK